MVLLSPLSACRPSLHPPHGGWPTTTYSLWCMLPHQHAVKRCCYWAPEVHTSARFCTDIEAAHCACDHAQRVKPPVIIQLLANCCTLALEAGSFSTLDSIIM